MEHFLVYCRPANEITINVPVVFMARYIMVLRGATSLRGALEGVGPENRDFFGPWNGTSEASAIWAQKSRNFMSQACRRFGGVRNMKHISEAWRNNRSRRLYISVQKPGPAALEVIILQTGGLKRILSKRFWSDQWAAAPLQQVANQWVALGGRFNLNQVKTTLDPPEITECRLCLWPLL